MDNLVNHIAIILARGGSKRLPRKNIVKLHGKPMIAWTIEAALVSGCYQRVLVSTDDVEIAKIARDFGAQAPFLRVAAIDDFSSSSEATLEALAQAESYWGEKYDVVSQLMANCPLRGKNEIKFAVDNFYQSNAIYQISCFRFGWMNPWWAFKLKKNGEPEFLFPEAINQRSQDLPELYCPSGAIWLAKSNNLKRDKTFYGPGHIFHPMHWVSAIDVDDSSDLEMAQICFDLKK